MVWVSLHLQLNLFLGIISYYTIINEIIFWSSYSGIPLLVHRTNISFCILLWYFSFSLKNMVSRVFWVQDHVICKRTIWFFSFQFDELYLFLIPRGSAILNILHCCAEWRFSSYLTQTLKRNAFTCFSVTIIWCQL